MMRPSRRLAWLAAVAAGGALAASVVVLAVRARPELPEDVSARLARAAAESDSLVAAGAAARAVSDVDAIRLGYYERLRLGLGNPFLLAGAALADTRLSRAVRRELAWDLLARVRRGDAYAVNPVAMDGIDDDVPDSVSHGTAHAALIARTVAGTGNPRAGELAVRLAYGLAVAEGTLRPSAAEVSSGVAALLLDRELVHADLTRLFNEARREHEDPLVTLVRLRGARALGVERPAAEPLDARSEAMGMAMVPGVLASIRAIAASGGSPSRVRSMSLLSRAAADRLTRVAGGTPPRTAVVVAFRIRPDALRGPTPTNEEALVAALALRGKNGTDRELARAVLGTAVHLRAFGQEEPWFVGDPGPTPDELMSEIGVASVKFDPAVPREWRPFYLRMLAEGVRDLQRVIPGYSAVGVRVFFGVDELPDTALAMHDPGTRTVRLSIRTSGGALAHELAHDLDWQTARRLYPAAGGYSTDHAANDTRGPLARSVRGLTAARVGQTSGASRRGERAAELFARDVDWFVAAELARQGRSNGYLSAVQDAALPGYAGASPAALGPAAAGALVDALSQMSVVSDVAREAFVRDWADQRTADPYVIARRALELRLSPREPMALATPGALTLELPGAAAPCVESGHDDAGRARLLGMALDARARGIVRRWALAFAPEERPSWAASVLGEGPWSSAEAERVVRRVRTRLVAQLEQGDVSARYGGATAGLVPTCPAGSRE